MINKTKEDNIFEEGIGDLILGGSNASKKARESKGSFNDELIKTKIQRNKAERDKQKYKVAFGASVIIILIIGFLVVSNALNEQSDKNIQDCLKQGYSSTVCYKMEGIY